MKKIAVIGLNLNFFGNLKKAFEEKNCELRIYNHTNNLEYNYMQIGMLINWCDFVFVDFAQDPLPSLLNFCGKPIIVRLHRIEVYNPAIRSWDWSKVNLLIFIADHIKEKFEKKTIGITKKPQKLVVLPEGVDIEKFIPPENPRKYELPLKIAMCGPVVPKKRIYTAIQLLAELENCELHIAGRYTNVPAGYGNNEYYENCLDLVETLNLDKRVHFYAHVENMPLWYQQMDLFLSLSNEEGYHASVMEAMACGCIPVIHHWKGADDIYPAVFVVELLNGIKETINAYKDDIESRSGLTKQYSDSCVKFVENHRDGKKLALESVEKILQEV